MSTTHSTTLERYTNCQSCGMPLAKSPNGGGSDADGSTSTVYCAYCYVNGAFVQPGMTAGEMQAFVRVKMKEMGFPGILGWFFTKRIPKLKRWSTT